MRVRWTFLVVGLAVASLAAAGCGGADDGGDRASGEGTESRGGGAVQGSGDSGRGSGESEGEGADDDAGRSAPASSKAEFLERANEACAREWSKLVPRITAYNRRSGSPGKEGTPAYAGLAEATFLPTFEAELDAVRALDAPPEEERKLDPLLAAHQRAIEQTREQGVESFDELQQALDRTSRALARYGLNRCTVSGF